MLLVSLAALAFSAPGSTKVYMTRTGRKYHEADCRRVAQGRVETTLEEALRLGLTPCSICDPPELTGDAPRSVRARFLHPLSGDTVRVAIDEGGGLLKKLEVVRFIGIAAAPGEYGVRGQRFTATELMGGMTLEFGPQLRDPDGQLLAYVLLAGDHCHNAELIRRGFARATSGPDHPRMAEFLEIEAHARRDGRGMWTGEL
jgi:endonuclease YncB( thermonuclease family)